jgi:hypothetical protein
MARRHAVEPLKLATGFFADAGPTPAGGDRPVQFAAGVAGSRSGMDLRTRVAPGGLDVWLAPLWCIAPTTRSVDEPPSADGPLAKPRGRHNLRRVVRQLRRPESSEGDGRRRPSESLWLETSGFVACYLLRREVQGILSIGITTLSWPCVLLGMHGGRRGPTSRIPGFFVPKVTGRSRPARDSAFSETSEPLRGGGSQRKSKPELLSYSAPFAVQSFCLTAEHPRHPMGSPRPTGQLRRTRFRPWVTALMYLAGNLRTRSASTAWSMVMT